MFSILAVSHGDTARAMVASAREQTFCDAEIETVSIYAETSVADARAAILQKLDDLLARGDVVVLTDLKLGTPFNLVAELMQRRVFSHITGMNLPLLLELMMRTAEDISAARACREALVLARREMIHVNVLLERGAEIEHCIGSCRRAPDPRAADQRVAPRAEADAPAGLRRRADADAVYGKYVSVPGSDLAGGADSVAGADCGIPAAACRHGGPDLPAVPNTGKCAASMGTGNPLLSADACGQAVFPQQARGSGAAEGGDPPSACRRCNGCGAGNAAF